MFYQPIAFILFVTSGFAETNRLPFDLPEAEAELVSGYSVEYSAMGFALFFLGEYNNILILCTTFVILFWGGSFSLFTYTESIFWFLIKLGSLLYLIIIIRATYPRYRFDQLIVMGWAMYLPFSFVIGLFYTFATSFS